MKAGDIVQCISNKGLIMPPGQTEPTLNGLYEIESAIINNISGSLYIFLKQFPGTRFISTRFAMWNSSGGVKSALAPVAKCSTSSSKGFYEGFPKPKALEGPCSVCCRMNDIGVKTCWNCGNHP